MLLKMRARARFILWTTAAAGLLIGQVLWLVLLRGPRILANDAILIGGQIALTLPVLLIALLLKTTPPDAIKLRRQASEGLILAGVALLQLAAVVLLRPALSEDVLRYRTDGRMWLDGISPYATSPRDWNNADAVDSLVPFPHMRTIYPAVAQATFAAAAAIERASTPPVDLLTQSQSADQSPWRRYLASSPTPYRASVFRLMYALAAVATTLVLLLLLRANQQSPWWAALLAWNPLVTLETGGMGHHDVVGVAIVLLSLYTLAKSRPMQPFAGLALATAVKPFALLLAPFLIRGIDRHKRPAATATAAAACLFATILILLYLPPLLFQRGYIGWRASARTYSQTWEANGSFYDMIVRTFGDGGRDEGRANERAKQMARLLSVAALLAAALVAWQFKASPAMAGYWLCLAALLLSPVVYPWYLLWALGFVPLLRGEAGWTAIVWSGTICASYLMWHTPAWRLGNGALLGEYGVVYAALIFEIACAIRRVRSVTPSEATEARAAAGITSDSRSSRFDPSPLRGSST